MGTMEPEAVLKRELDDSGCVQDESPPAKKPAVDNGYMGGAQLLDLSDDVLLHILQHCSPMDLKALGFSCPRLGTLIRDRSLWQRVDARGGPTGRRRLDWMLRHTLHAGTRELMLSGYAVVHRGCMGHVNKSEADDKSEMQLENGPGGSGDAGPSSSDRDRGADPPFPLHRQHARLHINVQQLPRFSGSPSWSEECQASSAAAQGSTGCPGPVFTLTPLALTRLCVRCPNLTSLALDGCNINCNTIGINMLPPTLKKLSLRGAKCYNLPMDRSFLFKIQDYLPDLEELDVSECDWMEPASLLPLSKMKNLQVLLMRDCLKMSEFVAYASLATRYGFKALRVVDLSGSPVGDSEVSALGWVVGLEELHLCPSTEASRGEHSHTRGAPLPAHNELESWEEQEPSYFTSRASSVDSEPERRSSTSSEEFSRQVLTMKARLGRASNDGDASTSSNSKGDTPEGKSTKESPGDSVEQPSPTRYSLRCRSKAGENGAQTFATPGPSRRKKDSDRNPEKPSPGESPGKSEVGNKRSQGKGTGAASSRRTPEKSRDKSKGKGKDCVASEKRADSPKTNGAKRNDNNAHKKSEVATSDLSNARVTRSSANASLNTSPNTSKKNTRKTAKEVAKPNESDATPVTRKSLRNQTPNSHNKAGGDNATRDNARRRRSNSESATAKPAKRKVDGNNSTGSDGESTPKRTHKTRGAVNEGASTSKSAPSQSQNRSRSQSRNSNGKGKKPAKRLTRANAEKSADSTSKKADDSESSDSDDDDSAGCRNGPTRQEAGSNDPQYISCRFGQDRPPELLRLPFMPAARNEEDEPLPPPDPQDRVLEPNHHLLYVNVGERYHAVYRLTPNRPAFGGCRSRARASNLRGICHQPPPHVDAAALVTDAAVRGFGRSEVEDMNYVLIGPNGLRQPRAIYNRLIGPGGQNITPAQRPDRVALRVLTITGYRNITDRSLIHLAEAAPHLRFIDFTGTSVTERGVENFKALRPDCEVKFSSRVKKEDGAGD